MSEDVTLFSGSIRKLNKNNGNDFIVPSRAYEKDLSYVSDQTYTKALKESGRPEEDILARGYDGLANMKIHSYRNMFLGKRFIFEGTPIIKREKESFVKRLNAKNKLKGRINCILYNGSISELNSLIPGKQYIYHDDAKGGEFVFGPFYKLDDINSDITFREIRRRGYDGLVEKKISVQEEFFSPTFSHPTMYIRGLPITKKPNGRKRGR